MPEVHQAAAGGKGGEPPAVGEMHALDLGDPEAMSAWLARLRAQIDDVIAAGEDATRPPGQRRLGRAAARQAMTEARRALEQLLSAAEPPATEG
jgi:hypothetical protein